MLGEGGGGIRETARVLGLTPGTILRLVRRVGEHVQGTVAHHLRDLFTEEIPLDELWSFRRKKEANLTALETVRQEFGDCWIRVAFDPVHTVVVGFVIGKRTRENAGRLLQAVRRTLGKGCLPLFTRDELACYEDTLIEVFGTWIPPLRLGERGRYPQSVTVPPEELRYAVVHKEREQNRGVRGTRKVCLGSEAEVNRLLDESPVSGRINTSFVERENGKRRADNGRLVRKTLGFSKKKGYFLDSVRLSIAYNHFCRSHRGLRPEHSPGELPHGAIWEKRSPMMALAKATHICTVRELLLYRAPRVDSSRIFGEMQ
jgi:IS1 family transposase